MKISPFVYLPFVIMGAIGAAGAMFRSGDAADTVPLATPSERAAIETEVATQYATPTATLQIIETVQAELAAAREEEYQTRLQLASLIDAHAEVTAEHERNLIEFARLTESAKSLEVKAAEITATVLPVMATEAQASRDYQMAQNQFAENYPALVREKAESEAYAKSADAIQAAELFWQFAFGFAVIGLTSLMVFVVVYRNGVHVPKQEKQEAELIDFAELERQQNQSKMFFRPVVNEQSQPVQRRMKTEIPCSDEEFLEFAEGVIRLNKGLVYGAWAGSEVYKRLNGLRHWMEGEGFAEPVPNHPAELSVTADGEKYLIDSLEAGEPISPYCCKYQNQTNEGE